ncbi:uncharacterized protein [Aristolochia californica]|uniref:uncharacterized protein n=1 Tax=Aristolochia californica TaxID=171875 RepID=UPI0035DCFA07
MPLTRLAADAFGVVTVILVCLLTLIGLLCICYSIYFHSRVRQHGFLQLGYFNGPWVIRITLISITIWWGLGEIIRLSFLKGSGRGLHSLSLQWQENICKFYILSNLGFAEPSLFLTLGLLLHASLLRREVGTLSPRWNRKTFIYVLLFCFPVFLAQLVLILIGIKLNKEQRYRMLPKYFTSTSASSRIEGFIDTALCTYPLLNTILYGFFAIVVIFYFVYLGVRMVSLVINKGLRRRVYLLIASIVSFLPFRVLFLGFSVLSHPGKFAFEVLVFSAFFMLTSCSAVGICLLVYCPVADSLALQTFHRLETGDWSGPGLGDETADGSIVATQSLLEAASSSAARNSDASIKGGSISFRIMIKDEDKRGGLEELGLFSANSHNFSPPGSPPLPGRPMIPLREFSDY